ncbi:unnamed protein product, partial [Callosobruchus maculatus]
MRDHLTEFLSFHGSPTVWSMKRSEISLQKSIASPPAKKVFVMPLFLYSTGQWTASYEYKKCLFYNAQPLNHRNFIPSFKKVKNYQELLKH